MVEPIDIKKKEQEADDRAKGEKMIANQWRDFSKTLAYKDLLTYIEQTQGMLLDYAQEMVMPSPVKEGEQIIISAEKAHSLLQNRRGIDIVKTYVEGYVNITT